MTSTIARKLPLVNSAVWLGVGEAGSAEAIQLLAWFTNDSNCSSQFMFSLLPLFRYQLYCVDYRMTLVVLFDEPGDPDEANDLAQDGNHQHRLPHWIF